MDELRRLRELGQVAPDPDPQRKAQARSELLELAAAEQETAAEEPTRGVRLADRLAALRERLLRPAPAAGLATLVLVAIAGTVVVLSEPSTDPSRGIADPAARPETSIDPDTEPEVEPDTGVELAASCTDPEGRITVAYPEDWHTPEGSEPGACRFFGEQDFEIDAAIGGAPLAELEVVVEPTPIDEVAAPGVSFDERTRDEFDIDGRRALRQRLVITGQAALPEGVLVERILIDLDGTTLRLSLHDEDDDRLDRRGTLLEDMARAVEFHDG